MPEIRWLSRETLIPVQELLLAEGIMEFGESIVRLEKAGDGNMNVVLRAIISSPRNAHDRSLIVKQSRPYVAKYDSIPAPLERVAFEAAFYEFAQQHPSIAGAMPRILGWIPEQSVLVLQDLGTSSDATYLYANPLHSELPTCVPALLDWLHSLHKLSRDNLDIERYRNTQLRQLNHAHIFEIPFQEPSAVDLGSICGGLSEATSETRQDKALKRRASELGQIYLSDGDCLLHGDFYPGSWLITPSGPRVIDPEFCFAGMAEFDLGIVLAHLQILGCPNADEFVSQSVQLNQPTLDMELVQGFASVEVLRRLLGVAAPLGGELGGASESDQASDRGPAGHRLKAYYLGDYTRQVRHNF